MQEIKDEIEDSLNRYLGIKSEITFASKINDRSCNIKAKNSHVKFKILKNKCKLKNLRRVKMFINNDLTPNKQKMQKKIRNEIKK